ncbi:MAG: HAMP domain-containing histidine kinase, partial [Desulfobacterales bacterium]|nr:HAMP domain-containing histidine kinase [Desulfobacterales bacterium]
MQQGVSEELQEVLARLIDRFDHLNRMINDLLLLSKFDTSQVDLNRVPLRLDLLIKNLYDLFQVLAEEKGICLEMSTVPETLVVGDKRRLQRLFGNLIDNAIKYTREGSVRITSQRNGNWVSVRVDDTGMGISK